MNTKALVVLSGGQDSTTTLFWAIRKFDEVHAVTFDYGQRHRIEIEAARTVAKMAGVKSHEIIELPNCLHSSSPLTSDNPLEQYEDPDQMAEVIGNRIEKTFVPMRNMLFLTVAMNRAVELRCGWVVTGICQEDNANYPDCRDKFRNLFEAAANEALGLDSTYRINVLAPLMYMDKSDTVRMAHADPACWAALAFSHTSYDGKYPPTDMNHANVLRADGFARAGLPDPLVLRAYREGLMDLPAGYNYDDERG